MRNLLAVTLALILFSAPMADDRWTYERADRYFKIQRHDGMRERFSLFGIFDPKNDLHVCCVTNCREHVIALRFSLFEPLVGKHCGHAVFARLGEDVFNIT